MTNWKLVLILLGLFAIAVWLAVVSFPEDKLKIVACDVGQGDALLISLKTTQVLIDGGPGSRVLGCLGRHMPFWDRTIEVVVLTHPQDDHYAGLIEVFENYKVDYFLGNEIASGNQGYRVLESLVGGKGVRVLRPHEDLTLRYSLMFLDVVYPFRYVTEKADSNVNNLSIVVALQYGSFDALFTGDIEEDIIGTIIAGGKLGDIDYLKVPHHGSRNGLSEQLLEITLPEVAAISSGKNNRYGHPHKEVLELLEKYGVTVLRTDVMGDVVVVTDGKTWRVEN